MVAELLLLICFGWGIYRFTRANESDFATRFVSGLLPVGFGILALMIWRQASVAIFIDWSAARLLPTFALAAGYNVYSLPDSGPILNALYGPVTYLIYLPSVLFPNPTTAILSAALISSAIVLAPALLLHRSAHQPDPQGRFWMLAGMLFFGLGLWWNPFVGASTVAGIGADAPAVGFSLLACWAAVLRTPGAIALSAALGVLAIFSKQIAIMTPLALTVFFALVHGRNAAGRYLLFTALFGMVGALTFALIFGPREIWFNLIHLLSRHPWDESTVQGVLRIASRGLLICALPIAAAVLAILLSLKLRHALRLQRLDRTEEPVAAVLLLGFLALPTSILGLIKVGGSVNSLHSWTYLLLGASLGLSRVAASRISGLRAVTRGAMALMGLLFLGKLWEDLPVGPKRITWEEISSNPQETAFLLARAYPGTCYFPWHPLSSFMAERSLYHFSYGVTDLELGGYPVSSNQIRAHLPPNLRLIGYYHFTQDQEMLNRLPEFARKISLPEIPNWTFYGAVPDPESESD